MCLLYSVSLMLPVWFFLLSSPESDKSQSGFMSLSVLTPQRLCWEVVMFGSDLRVALRLEKGALAALRRRGCPPLRLPSPRCLGAVTALGSAAPGSVEGECALLFPALLAAFTCLEGGAWGSLTFTPLF